MKPKLIAAAVASVLVWMGLLLPLSLAVDATAQTIQPEVTWGTFGAAPGQFHQPKGMAISSLGDVYVMDTLNDRVQVFTSDGVFIRSWGMFPPGQAEFIGPSDLVINSSGQIVVSNFRSYSLNVFTPTGQFLRVIRLLGASPCLTVDDNGNYFVSEWDFSVSPMRARIEKLDSSGRSVATFGSGLLGITPLGVLLNSANQVVVSDTRNSRVLTFGADGSYIQEWLHSGTAPGSVRSPQGLAEDSAGNIYVVDTGNHRIQVFGPSGAYLGHWGEFGINPGEFRFPWDVAVDASGAVYVTDTFNHRIQKFRPDLTNTPSLTSRVRPTTWGRIKAMYGNNR